jgi:Protein of unknown function (DUF3592)
VVSTVQSRPLRGGVETQGKVVAIETSRSRFAGSRRVMQTYAPRVEFYDSAGAPHSVTTTLSSGVPPEVGAIVRISYLPQRPDRARILNGSATRTGRYLFLVVGIGFLAVAVWLAAK